MTQAAAIVDEMVKKWRERSKRHEATAMEALFYAPGSYLTPTQRAMVGRVAVFLAGAEMRGARKVLDRWAEAAGDDLESLDLDALLAEAE